MGAKRKRTKYTDKFRTDAVLMLELQGYPNEKGSLARVANHLKVSPNTLRGWFTAKHNPPPTQLRDVKKGEILRYLDNELLAIFERMGAVRDEATFRELATAAGIFMDKKQLLSGEPTENNSTRIVIEYADNQPTVTPAARSAAENQISA